MKFKTRLSKGELAKLIPIINRSGFNPCDKYALGFNPQFNLYEMKLLKDDEELKISFASKRVWDLKSIEKQLESYIEQR